MSGTAYNDNAPVNAFPRGQVATRHLARGLAFGAKGQLAEARAEQVAFDAARAAPAMAERYLHNNKVARAAAAHVARVDSDSISRARGLSAASVPRSLTTFCSRFRLSGWFQSRPYHVSGGFRVFQDVSGSAGSVQNLDTIKCQNINAKTLQTPKQATVMLNVGAALLDGELRARSYCRFKGRDAESLRKSGIEWMSGGTKR